MLKFSVLVSAAAGLILAVPGYVSADDSELKTALANLLENSPAMQLGIQGRRMDGARIDQELLLSYQNRGLEPVWVAATGPVGRAEILYGTLKIASNEGLNSGDYHLSAIEKLWASRDFNDLAKLELLLSVGLTAYVADAREGRADPRKLDVNLFASARDVKVDPVELAIQAVNAPDLADFLRKQVPGNVYYQKLRDALAKYRALGASGGWGSIPKGDTLKPGMESERIPRVRKRLYMTGDIENKDVSSRLFDAPLESAVKVFQTRHHLDIDGLIGKRTLAAMNIPVEKVIRRIVINMERWRWLPHDLGRKRVFVNIAGFKLAGSENNTVDIQMPVIVGKKYHETPVFSDSIKYIEFNPYWNIPTSIAVREMLPKLLKNPYYLRGRNIRVFSGWGADAVEVDSTAINWRAVGGRIKRFKLRQDPGRKNSLGRIKFMFPNRFNVYLHDTPGQSLFRRSRRDFSHGCIRVSRPLVFASYLLGGEQKGWSLSKIKNIVATGKRKIVKLEQPHPIHILYRTAMVGDDGLLYLADDIYGRDRLLEMALF